MIILQRLGKWFVDFWIVLAFGVAATLLLPQAQAAMIGTETVQAQDERARVKAILERPELAKGLQKMGIAPGDALGRVDAMSDAEVLQLAGRLDAAIAGGQLTNEQLLLIIIIILLIIIII
ncbi:MAG TPA: PA2779 family protein [Burkholderiales bacterium]|nr:PA2779 family protein [Burkholderiales bacterium]